MNTILNSLEIQFLSYQILYTDLECFDPQRFDDTRKMAYHLMRLLKYVNCYPLLISQSSKILFLLLHLGS
jgi:hypothetical protein